MDYRLMTIPDIIRNMQQILVIHGGDAFETHEEYIRSLEGMEISLERMKQQNWKSNLQKDLGEQYEVFTPKFPNAQNARYEEWKIIFEKVLPLLDENSILIGHSLGGIFLAKYLSENEIRKSLKATFLISAPYSTPDHEPIVDFTLNTSLSDTGNTGDGIYIYHSKDDIVVPYEDAEIYKRELPNAVLEVFEDRGHFNQDHFPELVEAIKEL